MKLRQKLGHWLPHNAASLRHWMVVLLQCLMAIELVFALYQGQWLNTVLILGIILITLGPLVFATRIPVHIPAEFHILTVVFVFAALFLGEIRDYYERLWWWDIGLHAFSGLLLGIMGFLLVYVLNENERIRLSLRPSFVAFFAFIFAVATGAIWEIFEFAMDALFGLNMQKPMLGDDSGLTDTMSDLILDTLGAAIISIFGWWHMSRRERWFVDTWIDNAINRKRDRFEKSGS